MMKDERNRKRKWLAVVDVTAASLDEVFQG